MNQKDRFLNKLHRNAIEVASALSLKSKLYVSRLKDQMGKNKERKIKRFNIITISVIAIAFIFLMTGMIKLFDKQYNLKTGMSNYICVTYDANQEKEWIGESDGYQVYLEGLSAEECYIISIGADRVSLTEAVGDGWVTVEDLIRKPWKIYQSDNSTVYVFENYEIILADNTCIIRQLSHETYAGDFSFKCLGTRR